MQIIKAFILMKFLLKDAQFTLIASRTELRMIKKYTVRTLLLSDCYYLILYKCFNFHHALLKNLVNVTW